MRWNALSMLAPMPFALLILVSFAAGPALADTVKLKNGDEITGKVVSLADGTLTFKSDAVGELKIAVAQIDTIVTDEPIDVELADGSKIRGKADAGKDGSFVLNGESITNQAIPLANVASVNKPPRAWTGNVIASGTWVRGNTQTDAVAVDAHAENRGDRDRITADGWYRLSSTTDKTTHDTTTSERRTGASGKYDYFISGEKVYAYANVFGEKNAINNIDLRLIAGIGGGYQILETERTKLAVEAGASWVHTNYSDATNTTGDPALRMAGYFTHEFNSIVSIFDDLVILKNLSSNDYLLRNKGGLREKLTDSLFAQQWIEHSIDTNAAPDTERVDVIYYVGLGWTF
jgi:putative salt-induced outer membrane protein YdiY